MLLNSEYENLLK